MNKKRRTRGGESFPFSYAPFFYMPDVLYVKLSWVCRIEAATATHDRRRSLPCGYSDISLRLSPRCQESSASISIDWLSSQKLYHNSENMSMLFGEFVREIVGLDMAAAKSAFAEYLNNVSLDADQIYFVNQIIEYIVRNGVMKDMSVLQEPPFTDRGSIVEVFTDISVWLGIKNVIDRINANAAA